MVDSDELVMLLAAVFAGLSVTLVVAGLAVQPLLLLLAVPFGAVAYVLWYQGSGRLARRVYASVEARARVDGGDRERVRDDTARRRAARAAADRTQGRPGRGAAAGRRTQSGRRGRRADRTRPPGSATTGLDDREAYARLDLAPDGDHDQAAIRAAYRDRVKEVHPDRGGDEETFKRVTAAYEHLRDRNGDRR